MKDAAKITDDVKIKMGEFRPRFERMDRDFDRWVQREVAAKGSFEYLISAKRRDTDIEVISNDFRTFADDVQSILSASERQIRVRMAEVEGEDKREEIGKLERLLEYAFEKADERLIDLLLPTLKESSVWCSIIRGWVAGRFVVYKTGEEVVFDFLPYDPRWLSYQMGASGLLWTGYTTAHSPTELEDEYGKIKHSKEWYKPWTKEEKSYDVIEYWEREEDKKGNIKIWNSIVCNGQFIKEPTAYDIPSMPVLIAPVATRPPVKGSSESEMAGYGESIFAPNRNIGDLLNKLASMWASHANILYKQPLFNYIDDKGKPLKDTLLYAEGIYNLPMGHQEIKESPLKEISPTLVNLVNWAEAKRVKGSLPDIDIGKPPPSGTLYNLVQETSNRVYNPQLRNLNSYFGNICRLVEEQIVAGGVGGDKITKVKIKGEKKNKFYEHEITPVDLKGAHIIKVEFTARTPWQQMDVWAIADMAKRQGLPDSWIHENILKLQDPKYIDSLSAMEMGDASPKLAMLKAIEAYMKYGQPEKAQQLMQDMYNMQMQEEAQTQGMQGQAAPEEEAPPPPAGEAAPEATPPEVRE